MGRVLPIVHLDDVMAGVEFYGRLGFEVVFRFPDDGPIAFCTVANGDGEIGLGGWGETPGLPAPVRPDGPGRAMHLFVYVDDVDAAVEALRSAGVAIESEPVDQPWGERVAAVRDPAGNTVVLAGTEA